MYSTEHLGDRRALEDLINGTAEVQVLIAATVTVPTVNGQWTRADAVRAACWAADNGRADYEAHQVETTGAPALPQDAGEPVDLVALTGMSADEATAWTPPSRREPQVYVPVVQM